MRSPLTLSCLVVVSTRADLLSLTLPSLLRYLHSRVLITTDVWARGIDVQQVSLVINYDLPINRENYLHRIGRSGRFGRKGVAINFVSVEDVRILRDIEQFYSVSSSEPLFPPFPPSLTRARSSKEVGERERKTRSGFVRRRLISFFSPRLFPPPDTNRRDAYLYWRYRVKRFVLSRFSSKRERARRDRVSTNRADLSISFVLLFVQWSTYISFSRSLFLLVDAMLDHFCILVPLFDGQASLLNDRLTFSLFAFHLPTTTFDVLLPSLHQMPLPSQRFSSSRSIYLTFRSSKEQSALFRKGRESETRAGEDQGGV